MKFVTAIVRPFKLDAILQALTGVGNQGLTLTEVKGCGHNEGHTELYRGAEFTSTFIPMLKLEVAVSSDQVETVTEAIIRAARTGHVGDGKIFVSELGQAIGIRTGATDEMPPRRAA